jgi:hypothetical protein
LWLISSASLGASLSVEMKNCEVRMSCPCLKSRYSTVESNPEVESSSVRKMEDPSFGRSRKQR